MKTILIVAHDIKQVIGHGLEIPWKSKPDLQHFKQTTLGCPMVLGHTTWKSFGCRPLPKRHHVIVASVKSFVEFPRDGSTSVRYEVPGALDRARYIAEREGAPAIYIIGGARIYEQTLEFADEIIVSEMQLVSEGDKFFPSYKDDFTKVETISQYRGDDGPHYDVTRWRPNGEL